VDPSVPPTVDPSLPPAVNPSLPPAVNASVAANLAEKRGRGPIVLNARVAGRATFTGVERWAAELIPRLIALRPDRYISLSPPARASSRGPGHGWEQLILPARAARLRASVVFSPANLAPLLWPRNVLLLHDAAVLREPDAYSAAYRAWHRSFGLVAARRALKVATVSEFSRRELIELGDLDPGRLVVIHGGVDARFHPGADHERVAHKLGLRAPYVLTVATDDRRKNLSVLGRSAQRLGELGIELAWAGEGRPQFAHSSSIDGARVLGYVDDADLPGLYRGARAFVLPSRYEGLGLPCLEAMACGTPVVAADRAALPETCAGAALLVDPDDPGAIADAVVRAATDETLRAHLRVAGLQRAAQTTWERAAQEMDVLLRGVAGLAS
jgi:glycosyltransferase involved in cell wall biosynthesis